MYQFHKSSSVVVLRTQGTHKDVLRCMNMHENETHSIEIYQNLLHFHICIDSDMCSIKIHGR